MANQDNYSGTSTLDDTDVELQPSRALVAAPPKGPALTSAVGPAAVYGEEDLLKGGLSQKWLLNCLRRRWLMATLLGLLMAGLVGGVLAWLFPNSHKTVAYFQINSKPIDNPLGGSSRGTDSKNFAIVAQTQAALVKTPLVLERALEPKGIRQTDAVHLKGYNNALNWLTDELRVTLANNSEVLEIRYDGPEEKEEMKKIVNSVCEAFQEKILDEERDKRQTELTNLRGLHKGVKDELEQLTKDYDTLSELGGGADAAGSEVKARLLTTEIMDLRKAISALEKEAIEYQIQKEIGIRDLNSPARVDALVAEELANDPAIENYQNEIFALEAQLRSRGGIGRNNQAPELVRIQNMAAQAKQNLESYRAQKEKELRKLIADRPKDAIQQLMIQYVMRMKANMAQREQYDEKLAEKEKLLQQITDRDPKLAIMRTEIDRLREIEVTLASKIQAQKMMLDGGQQQIELLSPATSTTNITMFERLAIAGVGGLSALALTCYGVALMDFRKRRLNGPSDMDDGLGIRVLGVLPPVTARKALAGGSLSAVQVSEAIDNVRATLMHDSTSKKRQVVLVTSASTLDGCTTVAASLATSLARAGRRTLLIDGDLRSPSMHSLFGLPLDDGFSEVLRTEAELTDVIRPTSTESLYVITAGVCDTAAVHALATDQPQPIFDKLREQFDFIILDSAPILSVSDSLSLGQYVDGAILSVLRDHSELRKVNKSAEMLDSMGVRLLGTVVNGVPCKTDRRILQLHKNTAKNQKQLASPEANSKAKRKSKKGKAAEPTPAQPSSELKADSSTGTAVAEPPAAPQVQPEPPKPVEPIDGGSASIDLDDIELDMDDFDIDKL